MNILLSLLPAVGLTVYGQLVTKWRVTQIADDVGDAGMLTRLLAYLLDPFIISAYLVTFGASLAWMFVIERHPLSLAYPLFIGITIVVVTIASTLLFWEPFSLPKLLAIVLILAGIAIGIRD